MLEEQPDLKGRTLSTALKKKAREIWGQATIEQKQMYENDGSADAPLHGGDVAVDGDHHDDDDAQDPDFVATKGV